MEIPSILNNLTEDKIGSMMERLINLRAKQIGEENGIEFPLTFTAVKKNAS